MSDAPVGLLLLIQFLLIAVNAFFAAAEIAVISVNENKLRYQAEQGDRKAQIMLKMVLNPSDFLSTIQVAITLAGFLGSAFAADNFSDMLVDLLVNGLGWTFFSPATFNTVSVVLITLLLSYFTLVLGELVPKRVAMKEPEKVARALCGVISGVAKLFRPVIKLLTASVNGVLRLFGIDPKAQGEEVTEDEIRMMVDMGEEKGAIEGDERDMIENIFELNNLTAADCMTNRIDVTAIQVDEKPSAVLHTVMKSGLSRFPVYGEDLDDVLGTVTARDFLINRSTGARKSLRELLRPAYFVPESVRADVLLKDMQTRKAHIAIVVDEYGGTSGLVTLEDILEEIVGNIYDEYDPMKPQDIQKLSETTYRVAGGADIESINETLGAHIPEDAEYDTLGGLIFSRLAAIPKDGAHPEVACYGLKIKVEELTDRRVEWATVEVV